MKLPLLCTAPLPGLLSIVHSHPVDSLALLGASGHWEAIGGFKAVLRCQRQYNPDTPTSPLPSDPTLSYSSTSPLPPHPLRPSPSLSPPSPLPLLPLPSPPPVHPPAQALLEAGRCGEAVGELQAVVAAQGQYWQVRVVLGQALMVAGHVHDTDATLQAMDARACNPPISHTHMLACLHAPDTCLPPTPLAIPHSALPHAISTVVSPTMLIPHPQHPSSLLPSAANLALPTLPIHLPPPTTPPRLFLCALPSHSCVPACAAMTAFLPIPPPHHHYDHRQLPCWKHGTSANALCALFQLRAMGAGCSRGGRGGVGGSSSAVARCAAAGGGALTAYDWHGFLPNMRREGAGGEGVMMGGRW
ncbi:unnamed protein product [Closterium sp. Naga37s-1]|nr:unnamed protein product [Closterium sp. Naga37s-1]